MQNFALPETVTALKENRKILLNQRLRVYVVWSRNCNVEGKARPEYAYPSWALEDHEPTVVYHIVIVCAANRDSERQKISGTQDLALGREARTPQISVGNAAVVTASWI